ncbi:AAA-like domain-containing protein [Vibrio parahaemolyticus]|nr:AAA-like domain-containing protein [Vibrio parahaemolyticus]
MNDKVLKNYTTIPPHLYVERSADKQLRYIIEDMQRPGYVLVARQMGKTNLLFNARRNLESDSRKFVYIDLSNNFATERECYNFIVESILDVLDDDLWEIRPEIERISERTITDHVFYTKSLLKILRHLNKDLVIILDEIDALRTSEYSDSIFAVIRSNYFTRTNFPEFEKLTYILSGVIEPKDLIKDRNKSPFNIGEKIYLDDFSFDEFRNFINKSQLNISKELQEHIFSWTSGNPRLTFDICSDIESILIKDGFIDSETIDRLIKMKYLTSFDIAPIDHIRELVSDDIEIQEAVTKLQSFSHEVDISDKVKSKLYLYGIISSGGKNGEIKIKNKIIDESLNLSWINSLSEDTSSLVTKAIALIEKSLDYHRAIDLLTSVLDKFDISDNGNLSVALYYLGYAEHSIGEYKQSNKHLLEKPVSKNTSPLLHFRAKLFIGLNYYQLDEKQLGNEVLQYVVENYSNTITWANAALNLAINNDDKEKSTEILHTLINADDNIQPEIESEVEARNNIKIIKSYAYHQLALQSEETVQQVNYLDKAIELNIVQHMPYLMLLSGAAKGLEYPEISVKAVDFILSNQIGFSNNKVNYSSIDYNYSLHLRIASYCFEESIDSFLKIFEYSVNDLNIKEEVFIYDVASNIKNPSLRVKFFHYYFDKIPKFADLSLYRAYIISSVSSSKKSSSYFIDYISAILELETIDLEDIAPLSILYKTRISQKGYEILDKYFDNLNPLILNIDGEIKYDSGVLFYWIFEFYNSLNNQALSNKFGNEVLTRLSAPKHDKTIITEEGEKNIKARVLRELHNSNALPTIKPVRKQFDYGRNDKITVQYKNGDRKTDKFKKLERDIKSGLCEILH